MPLPQLPDIIKIDNEDRNPGDEYSFSISISGIFNWWKRRKEQRDLDNIKKWTKGKNNDSTT
jgi:hypothetical protein